MIAELIAENERLGAIVQEVVDEARSHDRGRGACVCPLCKIVIKAGYDTKVTS